MPSEGWLPTPHKKFHLSRLITGQGQPDLPVTLCCCDTGLVFSKLDDRMRPRSPDGDPMGTHLLAGEHPSSEKGGAHCAHIWHLSMKTEKRKALCLKGLQVLLLSPTQHRWVLDKGHVPTALRQTPVERRHIREILAGQALLLRLQCLTTPSGVGTRVGPGGSLCAGPQLRKHHGELIPRVPWRCEVSSQELEGYHHVPQSIKNVLKVFQ